MCAAEPMHANCRGIYSGHKNFGRMNSGSPTATSLALQDASKSFGSVVAVERVSIAFDRGSFVALVGPSGCGKTTILRMLGGLEDASSGQISGTAAMRSFCFQEPRLLPWRSLLDNVALPLELQGIARRDRRMRAAAALEMVRLGEAAERFPDAVSGGMKMRASLARALVSKPDLLLLDEPFGALDEVTRHDLDAELRQLWERERFTAVLVTHSIPEAAYLAERVVVFSPRPARVVLDLQTPTDPRRNDFWTSDTLGACVRTASGALLAAIASTQGVAEARGTSGEPPR
jgi:NitT/TauT family transport system ATP-binding protein